MLAIQQCCLSCMSHMAVAVDDEHLIIWLLLRSLRLLSVYFAGAFTIIDFSRVAVRDYICAGVRHLSGRVSSTQTSLFLCFRSCHQQCCHSSKAHRCLCCVLWTVVHLVVHATDVGLSQRLWDIGCYKCLLSNNTDDVPHLPACWQTSHLLLVVRLEKEHIALS